MKASYRHLLILVAFFMLIPSTSQPSQAAWSTNPSENTPVCTLSENQDAPQMVSDGAGGMIIVWRDVRYSGWSFVYAQRLDASGEEVWQANGISVCPYEHNQHAPMLISDGDGGAVITWLDYRSGSTEIYAQRLDSDGNQLWPLDGVAVCGIDGSSWEPEIASDGAGGAIICWMDSRPGSHWDIYAQRIDGSGSVAWTIDGIPVCNAAYNQLDPRVISDGAGGAFFSWQDPRSGVDDDIYCQRIDSSGTALWTANGEAVCLLSGHQQYTSLASDDNGGVYIGWRDQFSGDPDIYVQRLDGSGAPLWPIDGLPVCTAAGDQDWVALEADGTGGVFVAWDDERASSFDNNIYAQRLDGSGTALWTADGIAVCTATNNQTVPRITGDRAGGALLVWLDYRTSSSYDLYAQRIDQWGFLLWEENGVAVGAATSNQLDPVLLADGNGGMFVAWEDDRPGTDYDVYAQHIDFHGRRAGAAWSVDPGENNPACLATYYQHEAEAVSDGEGGVIAIWRDIRDFTTSEVYVQRMDSRGSQLWTMDGVLVTTGSGGKFDSVLASDGQGGALIAWKDGRSGIEFDIYAQRVDATGTALWTTHGVAVCTTVENADYICITDDGAGGAIISWHDFRNGSHTDVYCQHLDASGTPLWTANGVLVCGAAGHQTLAQCVTDGSGGAIISWADARDSLPSDTYTQRIDFLGSPLWTTNGIQVFTDSGAPRMISDGAGGAIITNRSGSSPDYDIAAQKVNASGNLTWPGTVVCDDTDSQFNPKLVSDGLGGAIIAWEDFRNSEQYDIYAQHISTNGDTHWSSIGIPICTHSASQYEPTVASDGAGGAIIAWEDYRSGLIRNIYAQHVDDSGATTWPYSGLAIGTAAGDKYGPQVVSDGRGGAIAVWVDGRVSSNDIYAQRVGRHGELGDGTPAIKNVIDHPDDQGGVTIVSWERSPHDEFPHQRITHYTVWSRLPEDADRAGWTWVGEVPAYYQEEYGFNAPTYEDHTGGLPFPLTEYKVMAHTDDHWVFWESDVRSGCSVDNLAPGAPLTLLGLPDEADVVLTWEASGHDDEDLAHYNVYRGTTPGFSPDPDTLIGTTIDIEFTDPSPGSGTFYYVVAGEDVHGNVGTPSNEAAVPLSTSTVAAALACSPSSGVLPFVCGFNVELTNQYQGQIRRIVGRINVTLANGTSYGNWRAGSTNVSPGSTYVTQWNQPIPALAPLVGDNLFRLVVADVTPAPYNQPPYPPAGDTDSDTATVTGIAP